MSNDRYQSPLSERYASKEMQYIFSPDKKFKTWRKLWIALAERSKKRLSDNVKSHVYSYDQQCPKSKIIIHLGATSCYLVDNTDIIIMTEALKLVRRKLLNVMNELSKFAMKYKDLPTLGFTH